MIIRIKPGDPIPMGEPKRYRTGRGYINLRWRVGSDYYEITEHRLVTGNRPGQVHHKNGIKDDNRRENLQVVTAAQHKELHRQINRRAAVDLYEDGLTLVEVAAKLSCHHSTLSRVVKAEGVKARTRLDYSAPFDLCEAMQRHYAGERVPTIAAALGVTSAVVRGAFKRAGIAAHPPGRPAQGWDVPNSAMSESTASVRKDTGL